MRTKLLTLVTVVAGMSIGAFALFSFFSLRELTQRQAGDVLLQKGTQILLRTEAGIDARVDGLHTIALAPALIDAVTSASPATDEDAERDAAWQAGDEAVAPLVAQVADHPASDYLRAFQRDFPEYAEVFVTDAAGRNVAMTARTSDYLQSDEDWWQATYADGQGDVYIGAVERDASTDRYAMNFAVPVKGADGTIAGVVRGTVDVSQLLAELADVKVGATGGAVLVDDHGAVLFAADSDLLMQPAPEAIQAHLATRTAGWHVDGVDLAGNPALLGVSFMESELGKELGWMLVLDQDLDELTASLWDVLQGSLLVGAGLLVFLLGLGLIVARSIAGPIGRLEAAAQRVAGGDRDVEVEVETADEIGSLAEAFNGMVADVRAAIAAADEERHQAQQAAATAEAARTAAEVQGRYLGERVEQMLRAIDRFAEGDLTVHVEAGAAEGVDEATATAIARLYDGFNRASANLRTLFAEVGLIAEQTAEAGAEIRISTDELAATAQEQRMQAHEVAAGMEEMAATVAETARNANATAEVAEVSGVAAREGGDVVAQTVEKIREIARVVGTSAETVERLGTSSDEIGEIVGVISDIADQTNLLALNAAIEAARAGDQGRGFAVVADEVRKLAERTGAATKQIAAMIRSIQGETAQAVQSMRRGNEEVDAGIRLADRAGDALRRIVESTGSTGDRVGQIAAASAQQSATSEQISRSVEVISAAATEAADGLGRIAYSTDGLGRLTDELRTVVARFRTDVSSATVSGDGAPSRLPVPSRTVT